MLNSPDINPFIIFIAAIFTGNILLSNFLGMCSFIAISKDVRSANGLGLAVTCVLTITASFGWLVYYYLLVPLGLEYLNFIIYIILIAAVVQILEMVIERFSPPLYMALGIFLPLITVNCAVLGLVLFMQIREYNFIQSVLYGLGGGMGWWLAIVLLASIRKRMARTVLPQGLEGAAITLVIIGFMAMAFTGFTGMLPVQ